MAAQALPEHYPFRSRQARDRYLAFYDRRAAKWPVPSETRVIHTDQGETYVRISGPETAPPLVMLNGISTASVMSPPPMITAFAERYRLFTMDRPWEYGRSVNAGDDASAGAHVAWLGSVLDALDLDRVYLLGVSLGGWAVSEYALVHPERVTKLVWMMPNGVIGHKFTPALLWNMRLGARAMRSPSIKAVGDMLHEVTRDSLDAEPEAAREDAEYVESIALGMQCFEKRPLSLRDTNRRFSDAELRSLTMPVLYVAGERETFSHPAKNIARLARVAPHVRTVVIPDCGHDLIILKPREAAAHIIEFLEA